METSKIIFSIAVYIFFFCLLGPLGTWIWKKFLKFFNVTNKVKPVENQSLENKAVDTQSAGWLIGCLERILIFIGIVVKSWEVLVAVVALKTVARYQELDKQINAEYFLIGSMLSILIAIAASVALIWYDDSYGFYIFGSIAKLVGK